MTVKEHVSDKSTALNNKDRCDRCSAQAYYRIELSNTFELLFCVHHFKFHSGKLKEIAVHIHDESSKLS